MKSSIAGFLLLSSSMPVASAFAADLGHYDGKVVTEWLHDGRKMVLVEPFVYVDGAGLKWEAPTGSKIDGASIPPAAWSLIGGPYEGKYREASVIHDVACQRKDRPWENVHLAFYEAMLASGVDPILAKIMYGAVYQGGPRWPRRASVHLSASPFAIRRAQNTLEAQARPGEVVTFELAASSERLTAVFEPEQPVLTEAQFQQLKHRIEEEDLSVEQIQAIKL